MSETFDLATFSQGVKAENILSIVHPKTGADLGIRIKVISPDSPQYRKLGNIIKNRNLQALRKGRNGLTSEAIDEGAIELLVGAVVSWEGVVWGGQPMECTSANVRQLFDSCPWIKEQVDEFVGDRGNFMAD